MGSVPVVTGMSWSRVGVTASVHNEGGSYIHPPSLSDKDDKNDKESEKSPMRVIGRGLWKPCHCCHSCHGRCVGRSLAHPPEMPHRHALYDSRRVTGGHWLCAASMATHAVLGSLYDSYRGFVS